MTAKQCEGETRYITSWTATPRRCTRRTINRVNGAPLCYQHDGKAEARRARTRACVAACDGFEDPMDLRRAAHLFYHGWTWAADAHGNVWIAAPGEWLHVKQPYHITWDREQGWDTPGAREAVDALMGADHD